MKKDNKQDTVINLSIIPRTLSAAKAGWNNFKANGLTTKLSQSVARNEYYLGQDSRGMTQDYRFDDLIRQAMSYPVVMRDINLIARTIACAELVVQKRDQNAPSGWVDEPNHPFLAIAEGHMNPFMGQQFGWELNIQNLLTYGEMYWLLVPNGFGELLQMWPLPAGRVTPIADPKKFIKGYWYEPVSGTRADAPLPPKNVSYTRFPNISAYHNGLSPLIAYFLSLDIAQEMQITLRDDIRSGLKMQTLVSVDPIMEQGDFEMVKNDINAAYEDRIKIIRAGDMKVDTIQRPQDAKFAEAVRKMSNADIDAVYGIPEGFWNTDPAKLSSGGNGAYATFMNVTAWPLAKLVGEDLTTQVIHPFYGHDFRVVFKDFRIEDREMKLKEDEFALNVLTWDEARAEKGQEPYNDSRVGLAPANAAKEAYLAILNNNLALGPQAAQQVALPDSSDSVASGEAGNQLAKVDEGLGETLDDLEEVDDEMSEGNKGYVVDFNVKMGKIIEELQAGVDQSVNL